MVFKVAFYKYGIFVDNPRCQPHQLKRLFENMLDYVARNSAAESSLLSVV